MTPRAFKQARNKLGLSTTALATILSVAPRTVRMWEQDDGKRPPNPIACRALEWFEAGFRPPQWPEGK